MKTHTPLTQLFQPDAPLKKLNLTRIQLDHACPYVEMEPTWHEYAFYLLHGSVNVYVNGALLGMLGPRRGVQDRQTALIRVPPFSYDNIILGLVGFSSDLLVVMYNHDRESLQQERCGTPYCHLHDTIWNKVGDGTHARTVAEIPTPRGFALSLGETLNIPGGISSWPAHATEKDIDHFANGLTTWEEVFFVIAPAPGTAIISGRYTGQASPVDGTFALENGHAYVMPLGTHTVVAHPSSWLWYFWAYAGTALHKQYNKWATDLATYRK